jgi:hypothetical protein
MGIVLNVTQVAPRTVAPASSSVATLEAMARLSRQTASIVHVVVPREPGVVENARQLADLAGVELCVDLMAVTVRVRFDGQRR